MIIWIKSSEMEFWEGTVKIKITQFYAIMTSLSQIYPGNSEIQLHIVYAIYRVDLCLVNTLVFGMKADIVYIRPPQDVPISKI